MEKNDDLRSKIQFCDKILTRTESYTSQVRVSGLDPQKSFMSSKDTRKHRQKIKDTVSTAF